MHMADALISPAVGTVMLAATTGIALYSIKKVQDMDDHKVPLMAVMGAFVFAAQMINFSIPGTGSSGHLGGGLLLAILLGPYAGFLTMASVLIIQALFFADGGLLALGCNIFNLGFYPCFIVYPLVYRILVNQKPSTARLFTGTLIAAVIGLQFGAFSVVFETVVSGRTELPFSAFVMLMQPIHLAIGIVEGLVTASIVAFVWRARPEIIEHNQSGNRLSVSRILTAFALAAILTGGVLSWFASTRPDGLEWSIAKVSGMEQLERNGTIHKALAAVQEKVALLPDYSFKTSPESHAIEQAQQWPAVNGGTSFAGLIGGVMTLLLSGLAGLGIMYIKKFRKAKAFID
ncbi:MAG: energy-coupling factor ABC transporter permease [Lentisphaerota bacterium]